MLCKVGIPRMEVLEVVLGARGGERHGEAAGHDECGQRDGGALDHRTRTRTVREVPSTNGNRAWRRIRTLIG